MRALTKLAIDHGERRRKRRQEINVMSNEEISEVGGDVSNVVFSSHLIHTTFHHVRALHIEDHNREETVFEIESPSSRELTTSQNNQQPLLPYLKDLELRYMECMSHVWKYNWNKFFIPQKQLEESSSSFHNLTTIRLWECNNIKYLFSPHMAKLLSNLKKIRILYCGVIEEVVSNRDDEDEDEWVESTSTNTSIGLLSNFDYLELQYIPNLKGIGDGVAKNSSNETSFNIITSIHEQVKFPQMDGTWSLCQYARQIHMYDCSTLQYVIPSYALGKMQKLENLAIMYCKSLVEVFETPGFNIDGGSGGREHNTMVIPRWKNINVSQLSNLKELTIYRCDLLQHVFTFSTLESLMQLQVLDVGNCKSMKVIVKEENGEQTMASKVVVFPRLKSIALSELPNLTGFFLGKNEFRWPLLDDVRIHGCPQMMVFTSSRSIAPKLHHIRTNLGKHNLECGINFPVIVTLCETPFSRLDSASSFDTTTISHGVYWSFHNLIEMDVDHSYNVKKLIPFSELPQLQQLEKIYVSRRNLVEEVFEALEGTNSNEPQYVVKIPELREVGLERLQNLKYIWKNNPWVVLELPNLTKLSIYDCTSLDHVCSTSMFGSLLQLQELSISRCQNMEVIVNVSVEEECEGKVNEIIMLPCLRSLRLQTLPSLKGFCLGKEAFSWPSLDTMEIKNCRTIRVFTKGDLATPKLKVIDTSFGRCELEREEDLNSFINTKQQEGLEF